MKYLFILASDNSDFYLEQALLSITSLRMRMPNAFVSLLVDDATEANLCGKRGEIIKLVNEFKAVKLNKRFNKKARSRWLKTSMRQHIEGNFLYIDNDTIIADDLSTIDSLNVDLGAVLDEHAYLSEFEKYRPARLREIKAMFKRRRFNQPFDFKIYFNGGLFFCRDCKAGHDFFSEWHRLWLHCFEQGELTDQPPLNQANFNLGNPIKELDGFWNCQLPYPGALVYLYDAKIIHYFADQISDKCFLLANNEYFRAIKETGVVNQKITAMLKNPKAQFSPHAHVMLIDTKLRDYYDSAICGASRRIYRSKAGTVLEYILGRVKKHVFTPMRKKIFLRKNNVFS